MATSGSKIVFACFLIVLVASSAIGGTGANHAAGPADYDVPFYPDASYRQDVKTPSRFLGFELGSKPVSYEETLAYARYLSESFPNVSLFEYGETYEGRKLVYLTITSEANAENLSEIKSDIAKLTNPRLLQNDGEAEKIIADTPAVAWLAYSIHGDELSSTDAALWLAYQLVAGEDEATRKVRDDVVACIDPLENPDGRERWIKQMEQWHGAVPNDDIQTMQHRGMWPHGRGNHYLFDLNRDWFTLVHPESRGKIRAILDWHPQYFVDSHEMGPLDAYLFSPPREPFNPFMIPQIHKWWKVFAADQAAAFDRYGWSYYTREWNEEFYPGYGSSWSIYTGAIGLLYEQAGVDGSLVKRRDGTVMTYRETVHHQFTSSIANLGTVADNRKELLEDYYNEKKHAVGGTGSKGRGKTKNSGGFVFPPSANESRLYRLVETLGRQDIEVVTATKACRLRRGRSSTGDAVSDLELPAGTFIVPLDQPLRALVEAILSFDIRMPTSFLEVERKELLKNKRSKIYEITAWSLPLAYNVECYFAEELPSMDAAAAATKLKGGVTGLSPKFGYVFDVVDDRSYSLLARLFEKNFDVWCARKPFEIEGKKFSRGSFLVKLSANPDLDAEELDTLARSEGVEVFGVNTALATSGVDLGGTEFALLEAPRIGLVAGPGLSASGYGAIWHLLDYRLRYRTSSLDVADLGSFDLRKYNVIVLPSAWRGPDIYKRMLGDKEIKALKAWVESGGTLVGVGAGAAFAADSSVALCSVRQRRQVIEHLEAYERAIAYAKMAEAPAVDSLDVWEVNPPSGSEGEEAPKPPDVETLQEADELSRRLRPHGAILAVDLDDTHWLAFGARSPVPVMALTSYAYLAKKNVEIPARFAPRERVRLSGLLWPEARERWSDTGYAIRERVGNGQVILFADAPNFQGYFHGGERLLLNALFLGPGFGTSQTFY